MQAVYLDNHATTPLDPRVREVMKPFEREHFANPSSVLHAEGRRARDAVEWSRQAVAQLIGAPNPGDIVFTSGATEANHLALLCRVPLKPKEVHNWILSPLEHASVREPIKALEAAGDRAHWLQVDAKGAIDVVDLEHGLAQADPSRSLLCAMLAHHEIGTVYDLRSIVEVAKKHRVPVHSDLVQGLGKVPFDVSQDYVDSATLSAHKIYGPKGVGALYLRKRSRRKHWRPLLFGGGQEFGWRSGTLNVPAIVGFGRAAELLVQEAKEENARMKRLRDTLWEVLVACTRGESSVKLRLLGPENWNQRHPGNLCFAFQGVKASALIAALPDLMLSAGSACASGSEDPNPTFRALGLSDSENFEVLRICVGRFNTDEEIALAGRRIGEEAGRLAKSAISHYT